MLKILKVSGHSLHPAYQDGDFVVIATLPILFASLRPGDVIVFDHPVYGRLIKRIDWVEEGGQRLFVMGEQENSIDSRAFGPIRRQWVQGKVIWHIARRPA